MEIGLHEVCIVIDAGRFSATRIESISDGWSIALSRAAQSKVLRARVTAALVPSHEIIAGCNPFADMPHDERGAADAIMRKGNALSRDRSAKRLAPDDVRTFAQSLAQACTVSSGALPPRHKRIMAVYRQAFNYTRGSEEASIMEAFARTRMEGMTVLLIGRQVSGAESTSVQLHSLAPETLQDAQSVADHAWSLLERHVGLRRDVPHTVPAWSLSRSSGDVALMCDSCGSTRPGGHAGHHCAVCHMGTLHPVAVSRPASAVPAPPRSPTAHRAPPPPRPAPPSSPTPARPLPLSPVPASGRPTPMPPARPLPTARHPSSPAWEFPRLVVSIGAYLLELVVRLVVRVLQWGAILLILWGIGKCMKSM
jgi:hypothetical protein